MQPPPDEAWEPWSPHHLFVRLGASLGGWYVVGGWALDLWHGRQTRPHEDLEFAVPVDQAQNYRRTLSDLTFFTVQDGRFDHLAVEQPLPPDIWQQWGADIEAGCWRIDMMVDRGSSDVWVYKRDPSLWMPRCNAIRATDCGIPYLAPHLVLLFKARHAREKDHHDFDNALPHLDAREKSDLWQWLDRFHPEHDWLQKLRSH